MGHGGKEDEMVTQPEELAEHDPNNLGPFWNFYARQSLHGQKVGKVIGCPGKVVYPVSVWNKLVPRLSLANFLRRSMVIADVHVELGYLLTLEGDDIAHQTVGTYMVGTNVEYKLVFPAVSFHKDTPI